MYILITQIGQETVILKLVLVLTDYTDRTRDGTFKLVLVLTDYTDRARDGTFKLVRVLTDYTDRTSRLLFHSSCNLEITR